MKKISTFVPVAFAVSVGAAIASCWSFSTNPETAANGGSFGSTGIGGEPGGGTGAGDSPGTTGSGGTPDTTGSGGTPGTTGIGGSPVATGSGGSPVATGIGGSPVATGSGGSPGTTGTGGAPGTGGTPGNAAGPCDVLRGAGHPCVSEHSTVRALHATYTGALYQVCRGASAAGPNSCPGGMVRDIGLVAGGYADSAAQDTFCAGATCTIATIYDQSGQGNHLKPAPRGGAKNTADNPANATDLRVMINGHAVYGVYIRVGMGYRAGCTGCGTPAPRGIPINDQPETMYMVTSQNGKQEPNQREGCCFDYGNAETTSNDDGNGTMEAVYFGGGVAWGTGTPGGHSNGPWVMADLENGLYAGWIISPPSDQAIPTNTRLLFNFVTGVVVGDTADKNAGRGRFAIYGGDSTAGTLKQMYDGIRPAKTGYVPMQKQGSIILGIGGDNSASGSGQWFEGVVATGAATLATVNALQANIVAARYGR